MTIASARAAAESDLAILVDLYEELEVEMIGLKPIWRDTDGLPEPIDQALLEHMRADGDSVLVGEYDGVPMGFLIWRRERLLPQSHEDEIAVIRQIFTLPAARGVGVGEAMIDLALEEASAIGVALFDAIVPPGHRHAKNFFESNGFKARRIVMHRDDRAEGTDVG